MIQARVVLQEWPDCREIVLWDIDTLATLKVLPRDSPEWGKPFTMEMPEKCRIGVETVGLLLNG